MLPNIPTAATFTWSVKKQFQCTVIPFFKTENTCGVSHSAMTASESTDMVCLVKNMALILKMLTYVGNFTHMHRSIIVKTSQPMLH